MGGGGAAGLRVWDTALGVLAVHLSLVGVLCARDRPPRILGPLPYLAAAGYAVDAVVSVAAPASSLRVAAFTFAGEVALMARLLRRGAPTIHPSAGLGRARAGTALP